jgi:hypothetical protein
MMRVRMDELRVFVLEARTVQWDAEIQEKF